MTEERLLQILRDVLHEAERRLKAFIHEELQVARLGGEAWDGSPEVNESLAPTGSDPVDGASSTSKGRGRKRAIEYFTSSRIERRRMGSPKSSDGCGVATDPLPHIIESAGQYLSQPQQMRSGCAGWMGNRLAIDVVMVPPGRWQRFDRGQGKLAARCLKTRHAIASP